MTFNSKFSILFMLLALLFMSSCGDEDEVVTPPVIENMNLVDVAQGDERFTSLVAALDKAGLVSALQGDSPLTVFAPTNDAFDQLFSDLGVSGLSDLSAEALQPILLYHVVAGNVLSTDLANGYVKTLSTQSPDQDALDVFVNIDGGVSLNGTTGVTQADIATDNGTIHVINKVLLPPNVVDHAIINSNMFSNLVAAVSEAGLVEALSADGPFTIFAPTNAAFATFLQELGVSSVSEIDTDVLTTVLLYHVVSGNITANEVAAGDVATLNTETIAITTDGGVAINGSSNVIATDVQGTNGVIHVIDEVLFPPSLVPSNTIVDIAVGNPDFSILVEAVTRAGLVDVLSGEGNFTVFAPTNTAFANLLSDLGLSSLDDVPTEMLTNIVLYHALGAEVFSQDLSNTYVSTLNTAAPSNQATSLYVNIDNGVTLNATTNVVAADIDADNGVVHVIDKVLLPPNVVDIAIANAGFSKLVEAVVAAGLVETLMMEGPYTIFAPTDAAFDDLLVVLGVAAVSDIPVETLTSVLLNHVVSGNVRAADLSNGSVSTLNTDSSLDINVDNGVIINGDVQVLAADVQGTNGVIHVINKVLLP